MAMKPSCLVKGASVEARLPSCLVPVIEFSTGSLKPCDIGLVSAVIHSYGTGFVWTPLIAYSGLVGYPLVSDNLERELLDDQA